MSNAAKSDRTIKHEDVGALLNRAFDFAVMSVNNNGTPCDAPEFRAELAEQLSGAAWTWWYRAVDAAPVLIGAERGLVCRSAASSEARDRSIEMMKASLAKLEHRASDYRSLHLDDHGHLSHQSVLAAAAPMLVLARNLLSMAQ